MVALSLLIAAARLSKIMMFTFLPPTNLENREDNSDSWSCAACSAVIANLV
jgi:hypothetical protein